jgi:multiple sugar transport system ATP-binding protein
MLYVTHDQVEALTLGTRVAVLDRGVVQQVGPPEEIYGRPANRFVARFVGSPAMNLLPASIADGEVRAGSFAVPAAALDASGGEHLVAQSHKALSRTRLELGVRPEHVSVELAPDGAAQIEIVETAGNETIVHLSAGDETIVARVRPELAPDIGQRARLSAGERDVYLFDADTGVLVRGLER